MLLCRPLPWSPAASVNAIHGKPVVCRTTGQATGIVEGLFRETLTVRSISHGRREVLCRMPVTNSSGPDVEVIGGRQANEESFGGVERPRRVP